MSEVEVDCRWSILHAYLIWRRRSGGSHILLYADSLLLAVDLGLSAAQEEGKS